MGASHHAGPPAGSRANPWEALVHHCRLTGFAPDWIEKLCERGTARLESCNHGDYPCWREALAALPITEPAAELDRPAPRFGTATGQGENVAASLRALHPWRKGPLEIAGITIDTEWRSDWKWSRIAPHIELAGCRVIDIGCGNGYFGWRMLAAGADVVIGIDPTWVFVMQWLACRHFAGELQNYVLPLGVEHLPAGTAEFDAVFSMGVIYHRRDAGHHLERLYSLARPGGQVVLESLVLPENHGPGVLVPSGRYARMRNVWAIPDCDTLVSWVRRAGFEDAAVADVTPTSIREQRSTPWMTFESLEQALDPADPSRTVEGHPAPVRAVVIARRPG